MKRNLKALRNKHMQQRGPRHQQAPQAKKEPFPLPPTSWNISLPGKRRQLFPWEIDYTHTGHTKS